MAEKLKSSEQQGASQQGGRVEFEYKMPPEATTNMITDWIVESALSQAAPGKRKLYEKRRPDLTPKTWPKPQFSYGDFSNTLNLIDWFWLEHQRLKVTNQKNGFCQCESDDIIDGSFAPDLMRAFLTIGVFVDQMIHSRHRNLHNPFSKTFRYPKNYRCVTYGMVNANWFLRPYNVYLQKLNWDVIAGVAEIILPDTLHWLSLHDEHLNRELWVKEHLYPQISHVFEAKSLPYMNDIISRAIIPAVDTNRN